MSSQPSADNHTSVDLHGQVAIVTGASRGLGRTIAAALAHAGAAVAVVGRTPEALDETVTTVRRAGGRAVAVIADVTDQAATERMVEQTVAELGPIDLLVSNAGQNRVFGPTWEVDPADWRREFDVNFLGPFWCARAVLPAMVARRRGRIVNVASKGGLSPRLYYSAYGCAKTALIRLSETLALETAPHGIAVFAIHPGFVLTAMNAERHEMVSFQRWRPDIPEAITAGRMAYVPPDHAARLVVTLASGRADALSGSYLDSVADDVDALVARADEIRDRGLQRLHLATG